MAPTPRLADFPVLAPYNPWWDQPREAFRRLPQFRRDVFADLYADVRQLPQMVSVTGPRRVGKSTLLLQCIQQLIADAPDGDRQARRIAYFSLDDPALDLPGADRDRFFAQLVEAAAEAAREGPAYLFLDEVQRFPRWELHLKKYHDLKVPVRFVVSGSAGTPAFRRARESLLGRIKDFHLLPFGFREWHACRVAKRPGITPRMARTGLEGLREPGHALQPADMPADSFCRWLQARFLKDDDCLGLVDDYLFEGGFPEAWDLPTPVARQQPLYQNQVERVIFEDLPVADKCRKPEMLRRFYLALLKSPGRETNLSQLAADIALARSTVEDYFPLLEATDLAWRLHKHTRTKATPKAGNFKTYLVDLAVRNAVMKLDKARMLADTAAMGAYAENAVANHLRRWPGLVELGYWRRNNDELDFIVDFGARSIGVEVKYRHDVQPRDVLKAARLAAQLGCACCVVVARQWPHDPAFEHLNEAAPVPVAVVPLAEFLGRF